MQQKAVTVKTQGNGSRRSRVNDKNLSANDKPNVEYYTELATNNNRKFESAGECSFRVIESGEFSIHNIHQDFSTGLL